MNEFELAKTVLLKIASEEVPFMQAIRNAFKKFNVEPKVRNDVTALLGCELRHHYLLDNLVERYFPNVDFADTIHLRFLIANKLFLRRFDDEKLFSLAIFSLDKDVVNNLLTFISSTKEIIPESLDKTSPEFLALRFNTPAWVIKMWQKQYGKGIVFKILKANYRPSIPCLRVNEQLTTKEKILEKYPDLAPSLVDGILVYQGKGRPNTYEEFKTNEIFFMKMATKYVLDRLEIEPIKKIAAYCDTPNNIYLDLVSRFGKDVAADIIINHVKTYYETKHDCENFGYRNISLYNASASSVITCVSTKVGTMLCLPKSSTFDLLRSTPDYFLRIKQEQLDEIIKGETSALEECANQVELDGKLVYMVPTISKKESTALIANFLFLHQEFTLVEERQFFPFEDFDSCLYYAILKRTGESSD